MDAVKKEKIIAVIGGDQRQTHLANILAEKNGGCEVYGMFLDKPSGNVKLSSLINVTNDLGGILPGCGVVIFPLPLFQSDGVVNTSFSDEHPSFEECLGHIDPSAAVTAGMVPKSAHDLALKRGVEIFDYYLREEFAVMNAVPTAEGAVGIAIAEMRVTLFKSTCLVLGYGRIAKALVRLLHSFGAKVRVAARKRSDLAWARVFGCEAVAMCDLEDCLGDVECVFNTVPAMILSEEKLSRLPRRCLVIDLASEPGGVDFSAANSLGLKAVRALSLPGKTAPYTAGEIILATVTNILTERGVLCGQDI